MADVEKQKALALARARKKREEESGDIMGGLVSPMGEQFLAGVGDVTGALARPFEKMFGTIELSENGLRALSPDEVDQLLETEGRHGIPGQATDAPAGIFEKGARVAGQTAAIAPFAGAAASFVPKPLLPLGGTQTQKIVTFPQKVVSEMGKTFTKAPLKTTAVETGFGGVAGVGGGIAQELFPGSDIAELSGEILAPTLISFTPTGLVLRGIGAVRDMADKLRHPLTALGGANRAKGRARRAATPEQREAAIEGLDFPTTIDPKTGEPVLTVPQRTGQVPLLEIERAVIESSEELTSRSHVQIARANEILQESLKEFGEAPPISATVPIGQQQRALKTLLDDEVVNRVNIANERVAALGPKVDRETANRIAREELDKALNAARRQRKELFDLIPEGTAVPYTSAQAKLLQFQKELGKPAQKDIPKVALRFLDPDSAEFFGSNLQPGFFKSETRIKDLRALQSELRQVARNARAGKKKNLNKARIADEIANAILDDLDNAAAGGDVSKAISNAVNFSRDMADRFNKGAVGKILNREITGEGSMPAGLTLENTIGVIGASGSRARESLDGIIRAFDSPEAPSNAVIVNAAEDFMRAKFLKAAIKNGEFNTHSAQRFIENNDELLKRLPALDRQIKEAIEAGDKLAIARRNQDRVTFSDPKVSKATMLIEKGPVETFRQISRLKPRDAAMETQKLINRVSDDVTGEALSGLKAGFIEFALSTARRNQRDIEGRQFISGFALRDALEVPGTRSALNRLLTPDEINRLGIITRDLIRLEKSRGVDVAKGGIISDRPSRVVETIAGITGAAFGRVQTQKLGIGGTVQIPGIMAQRFRELVNAGVHDPASRLITDSITDEALFRELLMAPIEKTEKKLSEKATRRLNAWAAAVLAEHGGAFDEEEVPGALF